MYLFNVCVASTAPMASHVVRCELGVFRVVS